MLLAHVCMQHNDHSCTHVSQDLEEKGNTVYSRMFISIWLNTCKYMEVEQLRPITMAAKWVVGGRRLDVVLLLQPLDIQWEGAGVSQHVDEKPAQCSYTRVYNLFDPSHEPCSPTFVSVL